MGETFVGVGWWVIYNGIGQKIQEKTVETDGGDEQKQEKTSRKCQK